jgi:hypothetical protein
MESAAEYLPDARWQCCMVHSTGTSSAMCQQPGFARSATCLKPFMRRRAETRPTEGASDHRGPARCTDEHRGRSRRAKRARDADLIRLSGHPLADDPHQQSARAHHERDPTADPYRRSLPGWPVLSQPGSTRLRYIAGTAGSTKRYMNMRPLYQPQIMQAGAVA